MIVDAKNLIAGRMSAFVAKQLLLGEKVDVINAEKAVISGTRAFVLEKFAHRIDRGTPRRGPFSPRMPQMILKRMIRGMLPFSQHKGRVVFKNLRCHVGVPKQFEGQKTENLKRFHKESLTSIGTITIQQISNHLGKK